MQTDEEVKSELKKRALKKPELYYPVQALKEEGFVRQQCKNCKRYFWGVSKRDVCGEPGCSGGLTFIGNSPCKRKLSYQEVWKEFASTHKSLGYTPVKRYPVVARWNPTTEFTIASIAAFQPYVVSGEIEPPANPLVIPQFCLRFPDIDNVGITGHFVGFVMMGEHAFVQPARYNINGYFKDHFIWLTKGMKFPKEELVVHEDAWAGGGNFGPSVEFFSRGLEVSNQVYMQYEQTTEGTKELGIKVLDMGQGQERAAWISQGEPSIYHTTFPNVLEKLRKQTGIEYDKELFSKFVHYTPMLNVGENPNTEHAWNVISKSMQIDKHELQKKILPTAALSAVAEHTRALLIAVRDGALPSNVGGMYNLRVLLRRALRFIDHYKWSINLAEVCKWHAQELKEQYPELLEHLEEIEDVIAVEKEKYQATKEKTKQILAGLSGKGIDTQTLTTLYESHGIPPELVQEAEKEAGRNIEIPKNFYAQVAQRHEQKEQETATERTEKLPLEGIPETKILYYEDYALKEFDARVLAVIEDKYIILDETAFYPVSGGQLADKGKINDTEIIDVFKQGGVIVHAAKDKTTVKKGDSVHGEIDFERRKQLAQHHTATHIINAAARKVLGHHVNQASAKKDIDKAYIDITHHKPISEEEIAKIEKVANLIVQKGIKLKLRFVPRMQAEQAYGTIIYQGGAVPGKVLRIVEIPEIDVEACGGTHLHSTNEAEIITIIKATKVKDGVVRIFFTAGKAAQAVTGERKERIKQLSLLLGVTEKQAPLRALELFNMWKKARKAASKGLKMSKEEFVFTSSQEYQGDVLAKTSEILNTQQEYLVKTIERFIKELAEFKKKVL